MTIGGRCPRSHCGRTAAHSFPSSMLVQQADCPSLSCTLRLDRSVQQRPVPCSRQSAPPAPVGVIISCRAAHQTTQPTLTAQASSSSAPISRPLMPVVNSAHKPGSFRDAATRKPSARQPCYPPAGDAGMGAQRSNGGAQRAPPRASSARPSNPPGRWGIWPCGR